MDIIFILLLGLAGSVLGFEIPIIANGIASYKCRKKNSELIPNSRYTAPILKLGLCILNGCTWTISGILSENLTATILISVLFSTAVLIAIIDLRIRIVPNELLLVMIFEGIAFQAVQFGFMAILMSTICMIAMIVLFTAVAGFMGFDKVGAGDVKLAGAMGLALGYPYTITALLIMSAVFLIFSMVGLAIRKLSLKSMLPFAPFMMTGMVFTLAYIVVQQKFF